MSFSSASPAAVPQGHVPMSQRPQVCAVGRVDAFEAHVAAGELDGVAVDHTRSAGESVVRGRVWGCRALREGVLGRPAVGDAVARRKQQDRDESENADQRGRH